jgi:hypothetical protein
MNVQLHTSPNKLVTYIASFIVDGIWLAFSSTRNALRFWKPSTADNKVCRVLVLPQTYNLEQHRLATGMFWRDQTEIQYINEHPGRGSSREANWRACRVQVLAINGGSPGARRLRENLQLDFDRTDAVCRSFPSR